jgi:AraC family transcriptional activator of pobA
MYATMKYILKTQLEGVIAITTDLNEDTELIKDNSLYKLIWVQSGTLQLEVDHVAITINKDELVPLTPLHHMKVDKVEGEYLCLMFNRNFYCIYGHDSEVSCNGLLFRGSGDLMRLKLTGDESKLLHNISDIFMGECSIHDNLQEEMLRILLKRFIITCTRIAREKFTVNWDANYDIVRQYYVLVDNNFKEKKQVQDYADMLHRSPKTLSNMFAACNAPSPLQIIHRRIDAEARRLLLYTNKSAKEVADILGFNDLPTFSRFFKKMTQQSISTYRENEKRELLPN